MQEEMSIGEMRAVVNKLLELKETGRLFTEEPDQEMHGTLTDLTHALASNLAGNLACAMSISGQMTQAKIEEFIAMANEYVEVFESALT